MAPNATQRNTFRRARETSQISILETDSEDGGDTIMAYSGRSRQSSRSSGSGRRARGSHSSHGSDEGTAALREWSELLERPTNADGTPVYDSVTVYIVRHACEVGADYEDVHLLYAGRYGGDPTDDAAVTQAVFADIDGVQGELAVGKENAGSARFLERLRGEGRAYDPATQMQIHRTPRQQERQDALLARDILLGRAEQATALDISTTHESLSAAIGRPPILADPYKRSLLAEWIDDYKGLLRRLDELRAGTKLVLAKRMREKAFVRRMREQGWQGNFLVEEPESDGEGVGADVLIAWGVDEEIENAMRGTGALVLGFRDSDDEDEDEDEGDEEEGEDDEGWW
ncbi:hypothetical protein TWF696_003131 [Orbilia brochopaga]|uniref:Uncharacterized protein n=1 Tax=Orbilia brochopaga TaxID=3140254 RepID=A0AAV9TZ58_9PEZI